MRQQLERRQRRCIRLHITTRFDCTCTDRLVSLQMLALLPAVAGSVLVPQCVPATAVTCYDAVVDDDDDDFDAAASTTTAAAVTIATTATTTTTTTSTSTTTTTTTTPTRQTKVSTTTHARCTRSICVTFSSSFRKHPL